MNQDVYITSTGMYLPNDPIDNDQIEEILGLIRNKQSRLKKRILKSNGIQTRHYAIDKEHRSTISNSEMAANAGRVCLEASSIPLQKISLLSCATSQGDLVLPGFGSMVQADLGLQSIELNTSHGICSSSLMALKYAYNSLRCSEHSNALVIACEFVSRMFKASRYEAVGVGESLDFDAEFLRWMLSDGAGACLLECAFSASF